MSALSLGKFLIYIGGVILIIGVAIYLLGRVGFSFDKIPGNIRIQNGNMTCVIALGASIFLSILLTVILNIIVRFMNR
jgi:hypothetical protein